MPPPESQLTLIKNATTARSRTKNLRALLDFMISSHFLQSTPPLSNLSRKKLTGVQCHGACDYAVPAFAAVGNLELGKACTADNSNYKEQSQDFIPIFYLELSYCTKSCINFRNLHFILQNLFNNLSYGCCFIIHYQHSNIVKLVTVTLEICQLGGKSIQECLRFIHLV